MRSALELFAASNTLQSQELDEKKIEEFESEILQQYKNVCKNPNYDDFMRILLSIERVSEFTHQKLQINFHKFALDFILSQNTQALISPQIDSKTAKLTPALLSTILVISKKLIPEFCAESIWEKDNDFCKNLLSGLMVPEFFENLRGDEIYNKESTKETLKKAKIFVPQIEKLWDIFAALFQIFHNFPKDKFPDLLLLMGEYSAQALSSWTSHSVLQTIAGIIKSFSQPRSFVFGEYLLQIILRGMKNSTHIYSDGVSWCIKQVVSFLFFFLFSSSFDLYLRIFFPFDGEYEYPDLVLHPKMVQFCISQIENSDFKMKATGFSTLDHLVRNVNAAELSHYQEPIYSILSSCITTRELSILSSSLPLILLFLQTCNKITPISQSILDSLFSTFLLGINNSSSPAISMTYVRHLTQLLDLAGVYVIKYAAVLIPYLESALHVESVSTYDVRVLQDLLHVLQRLVANSWPRVAVYKSRIFRAAVSGVIGRGEKCEESILSLACEIIGMLKSCCSEEEFKEFEPLYALLDEISPQITKRLNLN